MFLGFRGNKIEKLLQNGGKLDMKLDSKVTQSQTFLSLPLLRTISQIQRSEKEKV